MIVPSAIIKPSDWPSDFEEGMYRERANYETHVWVHPFDNVPVCINCGIQQQRVHAIWYACGEQVQTEAVATTDAEAQSYANTNKTPVRSVQSGKQFGLGHQP